VLASASQRRGVREGGHPAPPEGSTTGQLGLLQHIHLSHPERVGRAGLPIARPGWPVGPQFQGDVVATFRLPPGQATKRAVDGACSKTPSQPPSQAQRRRQLKKVFVGLVSWLGEALVPALIVESGLTPAAMAASIRRTNDIPLA